MRTGIQGIMFIVTVAVLFSGVSRVYADDAGSSNVVKSWDAAKVFVPGSSRETTPDKVKVDKPLPVVIYMHGCSGYSPESADWGAYLRSYGYIVVQPDSFARRTEMNCDPKTKKNGAFPKVHGMRLEEIRFAFDEVKKSPWADGNNIFLMGFSEGGTAAARTKIDGFSGIIISGWRCNNSKFPGFDGIFAPIDTPILTLEWSRDSWQTDVTSGSCSDKFGSRTKATQVLFPGTGHAVYDQSKARDAVVKFIKENLKP